MNVGIIDRMRVESKHRHKFILIKNNRQYNLPLEEIKGDIEIGQLLDVFIMKDKVTMYLPKLTVGMFDWVRVSEVKNGSIYVDIGTKEPVILPERDLPSFRSVWPEKGDRLYVTLKANQEGNLFVVPAKERQFAHLINDASDVDLNDRLAGYVIRTAREGTVILSEQGYRGFIHHSEREREPRLGELVSARVIEVKEDGTLNMSFKPLAYERIDDDAEEILSYLKANNREMNFTDHSKPDDIRKTFHMSKSAFKRALGRLMRENKIKQVDGKTFLL